LFAAVRHVRFYAVKIIAERDAMPPRLPLMRADTLRYDACAMIRYDARL